ncbi:MAG: ATP-binding protein, partial [Promethearchaeota archaeon]
MDSSISKNRTVFPFTAIVNQERLKLALLLNAINPRIGGVLIRGAKGTGKSTTVRALVDLLPEIETVQDCPFKCNPSDPTNMCEVCRLKIFDNNLSVTSCKMEVVELPIGATEDRVVGTMNIERAIREGIRALEPGILAGSNQNVLYVDEINLLPDHITDVILDSAASGWNTIEREGISVRHPSRFILVGTMNPEEGELRPQLLDRLALHT